VPEYAHIAEIMLKSGATEYEVAIALGVSVDTLANWKARHPEFLGATKAGKEAKLERVERALFHRAVGYTHEATKFFQNGSEVIAVKHDEHYPPDTGACAFYLKNGDPAVWKDAHHVTASVHDKRDEIDMTDDELVEVIRKEQALRAAAAAGIPPKT
jgi:hypothetical protein